MEKLILTAVFMLLIVTMCFADTIVVDWNGGGDYLTIQAGINAASDGDIVLVKDGTYTGANNRNLSWDGGTKHLVVTSENGPDSCIIDCENNSAMGFYIHEDQDENDRIIGFTIKNCNVYAGIYCSNTTPIIYNNIIDECARGIYVNDSDDEILITYNEISNCAITGDGGGIWCNSPGLIAYNTIEYCETYGNDGIGGGIYATNTDMMVRDNTISYCQANWGGGIYGGQSYIYHNIINHCTVEDYNSGGGGILGGNVIDGNEIYYCSAYEDSWSGGYGGAIAGCDSIINNELKHNYSENGGTITVWDLEDVKIISNIIDSNSVYCQAPTYPIATGISCYNCDNITIIGNTISHGQSESSDDIGIHLGEINDICLVQENVIYNNYGTGIIASGSYGEDSEINIINCTITENGGHGISINDYFTEIEVSNCIVYDNTGTGIRNTSSTNLDVTFTDVDENNPDYYGCSSGDGCISEDPQFDDPENDDYSLMWNEDGFSLCIDTGDPEMAWDDDDTPPDMGAIPAISHDYFKDDYDNEEFDNVDWMSFPVLNRTTTNWMRADSVLIKQGLMDDDPYYNDDILYQVVFQNYEAVYYDNGWQIDLTDDEFDSKQGYKIELKEQYDDIPVKGISGTWLDESTKIALLTEQENWVGCFLEEPASFTDAFESIWDEWSAIYSEHWAVERPEPGVTPAIVNLLTVNPGELYIIEVYEECELVWNESSPPVPPKTREMTDYFTYTEKLNYMAIDVDTVYSDSVVAEIAVFDNDQCIGASKVYDNEYPVQILAYTPESLKNGNNLEFRLYHEGQKGTPTKSIPYVRYNREVPGFVPEPIYYERNAFATVKLNTDEPSYTQKIRLMQNYPNPVRSNMTTIRFMPEQNAHHTELSIYNVRGQLVRTIDCDEIVSSGTKDGSYTFTWDCRDRHGREVNNGIYLYELTSGDKSTVHKMLLMK